MSENEKFMRIAITLSETNIKQRLGGPFGAVIVKNGLVIASSANMVVPQNDPTAHAEISAIRLACKELGTYNLTGCEIYTSCEPCPMCLGAIYWAHIGKVYYANTKSDAAEIGFDDNEIYNELNSTMAGRKIEFSQLMRDDAIKAFRLWQTNPEKDNY